MFTVGSNAGNIHFISAKVYYVAEKLANEITGVNNAYTLDLTQNQTKLTLQATATSGETVQYEVVEEGTTLAAADYEFEDGLLMVSKKGTIVIRAFVDATSDYSAAEKIITVTVLGEKDDAVIDVTDKTLAYGESYTLVEGDDYLTDGVITMASSNTSVAAVSGTTVTAMAVGTATISIVAAEGENYKALTTPATFTVTVTAPAANTPAPSTDPVTVFSETFVNSTGTAGWSGSGVASGQFATDNTGWDTYKASGNGGSAKIGTGSAQGYATTPALGQAGDLVMTFKSGAWSGDKTTGGLVLSIAAGGGTLSQTTFDLTDAAWSDYSVNITGATAATKIKFSAAQEDKNRFFLDDVIVTKPSEVTGVSLTLAASGYASYCSDYPLDFSQNDKSIYRAWYVSDYDLTTGTVTFTEIEGLVKAGEGFFLYGTPGAQCDVPFASVTVSDKQLTGNELEGTLAPTYVSNDDLITNYGLSNGNFVKMSDGVVNANKAYLPVLGDNSVTPSRMSIVFSDSEATGISALSNTSADNTVYDLQGRRVAQPTKGFYIVNGRKVVMK